MGVGEEMRGRIDKIRSAKDDDAKLRIQLEAECISKLSDFMNSIKEIRQSLPEADLSREPLINKGGPNASWNLGDDHYWHRLPDDYFAYAPFLDTGFDFRITYNPVKKAWRIDSCSLDFTRNELYEECKGQIARWVVEKRPFLIRQENERLARFSAQQAQEREKTAKEEGERRTRTFSCLFPIGIFILITIVVNILVEINN